MKSLQNIVSYQKKLFKRHNWKKNEKIIYLMVTSNELGQKNEEKKIILKINVKL